MFLDTLLLIFLGIVGVLSLSKSRFYEMELCLRGLVTIVLLIPIISAYQAYNNFGQPLLYGLLADRAKLYILTPFALVFLVPKGWIRKSQVEQSLFYVAIIYLLICLILYVFVDPKVFQNPNFASVTQFKGVKYKLNSALIIMLTFLSFYKIAFDKQNFFAVLLAICVCYLFFLVKGRSLLFAVFLSSVYFFVFQLDSIRKRNLLMAVIPTVLVVALVIYIFFNEEWQANVNLFKGAFDVFIGNKASDASAASRVRQTNLIWGAIQEHLYFGNGYLSTRWKGGYAGIYDHFYPSDLGWLGLLYVNGIFGLIVLNLPFLLFFRYSALVSKDKRDALYHVMLNFMIYLFIHCAFASYSIRKVGLLALPLAIMYLYQHKQSGFVN
ncbi:MAG: hypothetical protein HWE07_10825 [Cytophagia bacterium]|nr:hypothetical protein [Cytophagia bacterium]